MAGQQALRPCTASTGLLGQRLQLDTDVGAGEGSQRSGSTNFHVETTKVRTNTTKGAEAGSVAVLRQEPAVSLPGRFLTDPDGPCCSQDVRRRLHVLLTIRCRIHHAPRCAG